jgi:hypothetical protein
MPTSTPRLLVSVISIFFDVLDRFPIIVDYCGAAPYRLKQSEAIMAKMDQDKTKEIIRNLFDYQKNLTQLILQRIWFRNILYYMGEQWFEWFKSEPTSKRMMPSPYIPTPVSNIVRDSVRSMNALIHNKDFGVTI